MTEKCVICGRALTDAHGTQKYCTMCRREQRLIQNRLYKRDQNKVYIRIKQTIPVFLELRPEIGEICPAVKRKLRLGVMYIIRRGGKQIIVRENECVEMEE